MTRQEKQTWFNLAVFALAVVVFVLLAQTYGLRTGFRAMAIVGLCPLGILFFRQRGERHDIVDERDLMIRTRSRRTAHGVFWLFFVGTSMTIYTLRPAEGTVPAYVMVVMVACGMIIIVVTESISTLILYRQGTNDAQ